MIYDLMGISSGKQENLMPTYLKSKITPDTIYRRYNYSDGGIYPIFSMHCNTSDKNKLEELKRKWVASIIDNPKLLLQHKWNTFNFLLFKNPILPTYNMI